MFNRRKTEYESKSDHSTSTSMYDKSMKLDRQFIIVAIILALSTNIRAACDSSKLDEVKGKFGKQWRQTNSLEREMQMIVMKTGRPQEDFYHGTVGFHHRRNVIGGL